MTPTQFRAALSRLGASQTAIAGLLGVTPRQARRWASGESVVPRSVEIVLRLMASGKITTEDF